MTTSYGTGPASGQYDEDDENQLSAEDTLIDRGTDDLLDEGYSPPERPWARGAFGPSESMDQILSEEEPDPMARLNVYLDDEERQRADDAERDAEFPRHDEVGRSRAGRLIAPDMGFGEDTEADLVADDVGISGGAASAEEAAMHIIEDDES
ncbi:hypothetical protein CRI77_23495 [Mycolicibacterium duvalii]|uniref:Uncharacterized protein n=1 Tax=Mycolicibacterium duvalii TaxID=39688 RepID=A0A7I7K650_9MYCO|nr:DUF5709 domain-containing protein [Mycolicibacterium duvalii]MCV7369052.1 hypothetical protein [Mycolicibacterium duvalii]PEG36177.1 hypothetical protein CRI77_23495 [Mycolicibacterium duvalii]BBX19048.1 hypothetical protein MDUV_39080 [Mycolicibacterium duvalii]